MVKQPLGKLVKEIKLSNEDVLFEFKTTKKQKNLLYKAALVYTDITVYDLIYQAQYNPEQSFKDTLIGAFVYHAIKNRVEQEEKKTKKSNVKRKPNKIKRPNKRTLKRFKKTTTKG